MFNVFVLANYRNARSLWASADLSDEEKKKILEQIKRQASSRVKGDLVNFFQYHTENGLPLTYIKKPITYVFQTNFFDPKSPIFTKRRKDTPPDGVAQLYEERIVFNSPASFEAIWLTPQECKRLGVALPPQFADCILPAYEEAIRKLPLRKNGIPWDYGMLLVGRPLRKTRKAERRNERTDSGNGDK
jgi:hypothetical protein